VHRGAIAEIDLSAIAHNLRVIKRLSKDRPVIAVVKADAYGHGCIEISKKLIKGGVPYLAVAYTEEAIVLRNAGIHTPIIVFFDSENIEDFFDYDLIPVVHDVETVLALSRRAKEKKTSVTIHVKIDTGMGRLGLRGNQLMKDLFSIADLEGVELFGLMSHFSDADLSDKSYALLQLEKFIKVRNALSKRLHRKIFSHIANSAAVINFKDAHLDAVRPGLMLYGYSPITPNQKKLQIIETLKRDQEIVDLAPAMKVKTKILCIRNLPPHAPISYGRTFITERKSKIGVLPLGYADGYNRIFSNNAEVLVKGRRAPIVGRICMDLTMVDLTEVRNVREGDEVVILGKQGREAITAYELAHKAKTIPYEILTSLGSHSRKEYIDTKGERIEHRIENKETM
jgi:alanine racemase